MLLRLANALYILARNGEQQRMVEARGYLEKALALKPDDPDVRASLGLTYQYDRPPDPRRAAREYRKALSADPQNEMALQNLASALMATGDFDGAAKTIADLEKVNPADERLSDLRARLAQGRNAAREQQ